jgi:hypothetical protein
MQTALKNTWRQICAASLLAFVPAIATASPGQTMAQFAIWAKANPNLHGMKKKMSEMSAMPYYSATFQAGSVAGTFLANVGGDSKIVDESVAVANSSQSYDILKHLDTASAMLAAVYGANVAGDFNRATKIGTWTLYQQTQPTALYRGKLYGYEPAFAFVKLIPLWMVDSEAKNLATCVKMECGD